MIAGYSPAAVVQYGKSGVVAINHAGAIPQNTIDPDSSLAQLPCPIIMAL